MSKRENDAVTAILADPENEDRTAEEVAERVIKALDDVRLRGPYPRAVGDILTDPENNRRSPGEIARDALDTLAEIQSRTHRLAVVGQIRFHEAPETTHTVVLGPFSSRGTLDSQEKFLKAVAGSSAARTTGQGLAWDSKTNRGRGRFMLAPAFMNPRDAWDFYRPEAPPDPRLLRITETIRRWEAGKWADEVGYQPACQCGVPEHPRHTSVGPAVLGPCPRHA